MQVVKFYSGTASSSDVLTSANTYGRIDDLILGAEVSDTRKVRCAHAGLGGGGWRTKHKNIHRFRVSTPCP